MPITNVFAQVNELKKNIVNLSVDELKSAQADGRDLLLVDLREIQERVDLGAIPGSKHVPRGMLEFWADPSSPYYRDWFTEDQRIIVYCAGGGRSVLATLALKDMGFTDVAHLEEGFKGWNDAGEPVEDVKGSAGWGRIEKS
ncbi:MAG: rhodanese-like domain-containing protein [Pseudomonadaceae bacterium]|nr:rhodanese-like domain-containing protein [Pseudomonadaceae bacterium]